MGLLLAFGACSAQRDGTNPPPASKTTPTPTRFDSASAQTPTPSRMTIPTPTPAPSTAGHLSSLTVPRQILGFRATPNKTEKGESTYTANGTYLHAVDASTSGAAALPECASTSPVIPVAVAALAGTYEDSAGRPGNVIQLEFSTPDRARTYLRAFVQVVNQCPKVGRATRSTATTVQDQRTSEDILWSEAGLVQSNRVTLAALQGRHDTSRILDALRGHR